MSQERKQEFVGTLKWFSPAKGYGFLSVDGIGDVLIHRAIISGDYDIWAVPKEGTRMKVLAFKTLRGWRVYKLLDPHVQV